MAEEVNPYKLKQVELIQAIGNSDLEHMRSILESEDSKYFVNSIDGKVSPLFFAAFRNDVEVVNLLLENGANVNDMDGAILKHLAGTKHKNNVLKLLLDTDRVSFEVGRDAYKIAEDSEINPEGRDLIFIKFKEQGIDIGKEISKFNKITDYDFEDDEDLLTSIPTDEVIDDHTASINKLSSIIGGEMNFKGIKNVDELVRKSDWAESVERIKIALVTGDSDHLLGILEKELKRVKRKQKKYNFETKKIKKMIEEVRSGIKVENVDSLLENEDMDSMREELELKEVSTESDWDEYNKSLRNRKKLL